VYNISTAILRNGFSQMEKSSTKESQKPEKIEVGKKLPGLKLGKELPEDQRYWDQRLDSEFGTMLYGVNQLRDGQIRWVNEENTITVTVESGTGNVLGIGSGKSDYHPDTKE